MRALPQNTQRDFGHFFVRHNQSQTQVLQLTPLSTWIANHSPFQVTLCHHHWIYIVIIPSIRLISVAQIACFVAQNSPTEADEREYEVCVIQWFLAFHLSCIIRALVHLTSDNVANISWYKKYLDSIVLSASVFGEMWCINSLF